MGREIHKNCRDRGRRKSGNSADLSEITRPGTLKPLDHFIGKHAKGIELKSLGNFQCVVVFDPLGRDLLLFDLAA